jgi:hypothetical protein
MIQKRKGTKRVWGIWYTIRAHENKWDSFWFGPIGVYGISFDFPAEIRGWLSQRPFFFRTRKQARDHARKLMGEKNITWEWIKYQVRPIRLSWEEE